MMIISKTINNETYQSQKVLKKEKNDKKNNFLIFDFTMKNMKVKYN